MENVRKNKTLKMIHDALKNGPALNNEEIETLRTMFKDKYPDGVPASTIKPRTLARINVMIAQSNDFNVDDAKDLISMVEKKFPKCKKDIPATINKKILEEVHKLTYGQTNSIYDLTTLYKDFDKKRQSEEQMQAPQ